jgi:predicted acetyltransferase
MNLSIRPVRLEDESDMNAAVAEFAGSGFEWSNLPPDSPATWAEYVDLLAYWEQGRYLPPDWVPATTRVADIDGTVAGRLSVRDELNEFLALVGGHIGYGVREAFRRQGIATALLMEGLRILRGMGLSSAMVTCKESNVGSATVIENCGGVLRDRITHPVTDELMCRYDITL